MQLVRDSLEGLAVDTAVVREMDRRAIEDFRIPGALLMEHAGAAAALVAREMLPFPDRVVVLTGAGNNAGDGFVLARLLANRAYDVEIVTAVPSEKYSGDAALNFRIVSNMSLPVVPWGPAVLPLLDSASLVVDALLGTGLTGPLRAPLPDIIAAANLATAPVLAIDVPSGLDSDTGEVRTDAVTADTTVTFALPKLGLFRGQGPRLAGKIILADIEMPRSLYPPGKVPHS